LQLNPADGTPTVPDQDKTGKTTDRRYLSKFWESERGEGGRLDIIDYICPKCHKTIYYQLWKATYCPHCGTTIFSAPKQKMDNRQYTGWRGSAIERMRYNGPEKDGKHGRR
jgi:DNA-directed RNA polymerase subunit RPC12/RpoP